MSLAESAIAEGRVSILINSIPQEITYNNEQHKIDLVSVLFINPDTKLAKLYKLRPNGGDIFESLPNGIYSVVSASLQLNDKSSKKIIEFCYPDKENPPLEVKDTTRIRIKLNYENNKLQCEFTNLQK